MCAVDLKVDGAEFAASHFPRIDADYLAQLKKLCVDRGLTVASLTVDVPFGDGDVDRQTAQLTAWIDAALAIGAPLVRIRPGEPPGSPGVAWREFVRGLKLACATGKDRNVTLALEPREASLVASPGDAKRALKECDSAWLRLAPTASQLVSTQAPEWVELMAPTVIVSCGGASYEAPGISLLREHAYIGFVSLDYGGPEDEAIAVPRIIETLRAQM